MSDLPNRVTLEHVQDLVATEQFTACPGTTVTFCVLTTHSGFHAVGHSACVDPENFNAELGRKLAREAAERKLMELEAYLLCEARHHESSGQEGHYRIEDGRGGSVVLSSSQVGELLEALDGISEGLPLEDR